MWTQTVPEQLVSAQRTPVTRPPHSTSLSSSCLSSAETTHGLRWATITHTHTHTRLTALCPGLPRWAGTRKVKPIWILLKQETVSGSGISWAICKSAPRSRQTTTPAPHRSVFTGQMPFLPPNQQRQSTEGKATISARISRSGLGRRNDYSTNSGRCVSRQFHPVDCSTSTKHYNHATGQLCD